jgi:small multidrug resistance family-3 protein
MFRSAVVFVIAAVLEIAGCFAFWLWLRRGASTWLAVAGTAALIGFAMVLARSESTFAGRAFAAYGGVYIAASLVWLWAIEGQRPTPVDLLGAGLCLAGAVVIASIAARP